MRRYIFVLCAFFAVQVFAEVPCYLSIGEAAMRYQMFHDKRRLAELQLVSSYLIEGHRHDLKRTEELEKHTAELAKQAEAANDLPEMFWLNFMGLRLIGLETRIRNSLEQLEREVREAGLRTDLALTPEEEGAAKQILHDCVRSVPVPGV